MWDKRGWKRENSKCSSSRCIPVDRDVFRGCRDNVGIPGATGYLDILKAVVLFCCLSKDVTGKISTKFGYMRGSAPVF